jgi:hypothetical protein
MPQFIKVAETEFDAQVVKEYQSGSVERYGMLHNSVRLYLYTPTYYNVEWEAGDLDVVHIGVWTDSNKKLTDYDGVFSIPKEIVQFLKDNGFDTSYITE